MPTLQVPFVLQSGRGFQLANIAESLRSLSPLLDGGSPSVSVSMVLTSWMVQAAGNEGQLGCLPLLRISARNGICQAIPLSENTNVNLVLSSQSGQSVKAFLNGSQGLELVFDPWSLPPGTTASSLVRVSGMTVPVLSEWGNQNRFTGGAVSEVLLVKSDVAGEADEIGCIVGSQIHHILSAGAADSADDTAASGQSLILTAVPKGTLETPPTTRGGTAFADSISRLNLTREFSVGLKLAAASTIISTAAGVVAVFRVDTARNMSSSTMTNAEGALKPLVEATDDAFVPFAIASRRAPTGVSGVLSFLIA